MLGGSYRPPCHIQWYDFSKVLGCNPESDCQTLRWCSWPWVPLGAGQCLASSGLSV